MFTRPLQVSHFERKFTALHSDCITNCNIEEKIHLQRGKLHRWQNIVPSGLPRHSTQTASVSKQGPQTAGLSSRISWEKRFSLRYFDNDIFPWWWWWCSHDDGFSLRIQCNDKKLDQVYRAWLIKYMTSTIWTVSTLTHSGYQYADIGYPKRGCCKIDHFERPPLKPRYSHFYRTRVRSLFILVTNCLTDWMAGWLCDI